jgi:hypothetical protein
MKAYLTMLLELVVLMLCGLSLLAALLIASLYLGV